MAAAMRGSSMNAAGSTIGWRATAWLPRAAGSSRGAWRGSICGARRWASPAGTPKAVELERPLAASARATMEGKGRPLAFAAGLGGRRSVSTDSSSSSSCCGSGADCFGTGEARRICTGFVAGRFGFASAGASALAAAMMSSMLPPAGSAFGSRGTRVGLAGAGLLTAGRASCGLAMLAGSSK